MDKLKKCPFCGGKARVIFEEEDLPDDSFHNVYCTDCGAQFWVTSRTEGIQKWNTRAETEAEKKIRKICEYYDSKSSDTDNLGLIGKMCVAREILEILEGER